MHLYLAKSSRFESTDFATVMNDDVGCSRRHQCPQCEYRVIYNLLIFCLFRDVIGYDNLGPHEPTWINFDPSMDK